jgi:glutathione synthase/RimK-type ligase-like ATP-grasp enzyme
MKIVTRHFGSSRLSYFIKSTSWWRKRLLRKRVLVEYEEAIEILSQAPELISEKIRNSKIKPTVGIVKDGPFFDNFVHPKASWLRYERYLKNNKIAYKFIDILKSNWIEACKTVDIIVWHTYSSPSTQYLAESKIYILERILNKTCFPSFHEVWQYEDKIRANWLYEIYKIPSIPTSITNSKEEAIKIISNAEFPIISKLNTGSGSMGVEKIDNPKQALRIVNKIFSTGRNTYWKYIKQKDYFYCQEFIKDAGYDLRIMIVGNKAFGYFRYPNKGDFKASGSGKLTKKEIPEVALKIAIDVKNKLDSRLMAIDMLYSTKLKQYFIIETSLFNQIDTAEQLVVNGVPGYYDITDMNNIEFKEGRFWIQELLLESILNSWLLSNNTN